MKNIMVDLETLGTVPGCAILSIGAVYFDTEEGVDTANAFYTPISRKSCEEAGLWEDPETIDWWKRQGPAAQKVLKAAAAKKAPTLDAALDAFDAFIKQNTSVKVWGNGADFDNPIMAVAYSALGRKQGWGNWSGRCYRTLKNIAPGPKLVRIGVHHNALDDAISQATHAIELLRLHPTLKL